MVNHVACKQLLVTLGASAIGFAFGPWPGGSALIGGLVSSAVNTYAAFRVLGIPHAASSVRVLAICYWAEMVKVSLAAIALASIFVTVEEVNALALFAGFFIAHVGGMVWAGSSGPMARERPEGQPAVGGGSAHKT